MVEDNPQLEAKVEKIARQMCVNRGYDPDQIVSGKPFGTTDVCFALKGPQWHNFTDMALDLITSFDILTKGSDDNPTEPNTVIEKLLTISTVNVTEHTCNTFLPSWNGPAYEKVGYGWFVYVIEDGIDQLPEDLQAAIKLAELQGCSWLMIDRDGPVSDQLELFDW